MIKDPRFASELSEDLAGDVLARFMHYVTFDTASDPDSMRTPSSKGQLILLRELEGELRSIGADEIEFDERGILFATLPATSSEVGIPTLGLLAHVDTFPTVPGADVRPHVHYSWEGAPTPLRRDHSQILDPRAMPELSAHVGHDLITSDGTTLLGADDKAGVAEIMAASRYLLEHPELQQGRVRLAFTSDEEIGLGMRQFDISRFGADFAVTLDGSSAGTIEIETFEAVTSVVKIAGVAAHAGSAKGVGLNAIRLAERFLSFLPFEALTAETTEGREGFIHPYVLSGSAEEVTITFALRAFEEEELAALDSQLEACAKQLQEVEPRAAVSVASTPLYSNMRRGIEAHPALVELLKEAVRRVGLEPSLEAVRGGTDGALLTARGLPTPNLFTGGHAYHSKLEWACLQDMASAAAAIVELVRLCAERSASL